MEKLNRIVCETVWGNRNGNMYEKTKDTIHKVDLCQVVR